MKQTDGHRGQTCGCQGRGLGEWRIGSRGSVDAKDSVQNGETARYFCITQGTVFSILWSTITKKNVLYHNCVYVNMCELCVCMCELCVYVRMCELCGCEYVWTVCVCVNCVWMWICVNCVCELCVNVNMCELCVNMCELCVYVWTVCVCVNCVCVWICVNCVWICVNCACEYVWAVCVSTHNVCMWVTLMCSRNEHNIVHQLPHWEADVDFTSSVKSSHLNLGAVTNGTQVHGTVSAPVPRRRAASHVTSSWNVTTPQGEQHGTPNWYCQLPAPACCHVRNPPKDSSPGCPWEVPVPDNASLREAPPPGRPAHVQESRNYSMVIVLSC